MRKLTVSADQPQCLKTISTNYCCFLVSINFKVLQGNHIFGPLLELLQEVDHQVLYVLCIWCLESKFVVPQSDQCEGLTKKAFILLKQGSGQ